VFQGSGIIYCTDVRVAILVTSQSLMLSVGPHTGKGVLVAKKIQSNYSS
jgi:hypothetical protein